MHFSNIGSFKMRMSFYHPFSTYKLNSDPQLGFAVCVLEMKRTLNSGSIYSFQIYPLPKLPFSKYYSQYHTLHALLKFLHRR